MSENTENVKKIRELEDFDTAVPLSDQDYLIVATNEDANNDGTKERVPLTKKAKISEAINAVNKAEAERRESEPDTVTLPDGTVIPNPLKGATSELDENGVLVDTTPVTAENLDDLVEPGSGLEVKTICRDELFNIVDCDDPSVKYRTKKLGLATSNESKTIRIFLNNDTGQEYSAGLGTIQASDGQNELSVRLKRLRDAMQFIKNDIGDSDSIVNIHLETDIDEGTVTNTNATYISRSSTEANGCYIYIYGSGGRKTGASPLKIKLKSKANGANAYVPMWFTGYQVRFHFVHFCFDLDDNLNLHAVLRSHRNCVLEFFGCKFTAKGGTHIFFDASRGGTIEIQNLSDQLADLDYRQKGFWEPAVEIDFKPRATTNSEGGGTVGQNFIANYLFHGDTGGVFKFPEYGRHIPYGSNPDTNFMSRIHFCSSTFQIEQGFFGTESNCNVDCTSHFTANSGLTFTSTNIPYFLKASGFNAILVRTALHVDGTTFTSAPGNEMVNPITQLDRPVIANADYILQEVQNSTLSLVNVQKNSGGDVPLSNYWEAHTF